MAVTLQHNWAYSQDPAVTGGDPAVAAAYLTLPAGWKTYGGWAEPNNEYGTWRHGHSSCTPTNPEGHITGGVPLLGTFFGVDGSGIETVSFYFQVPPGDSLRTHLWVVT